VPVHPVVQAGMAYIYQIFFQPIQEPTTTLFQK